MGKDASGRVPYRQLLHDVFENTPPLMLFNGPRWADVWLFGRDVVECVREIFICPSGHCHFGYNFLISNPGGSIHIDGPSLMIAPGVTEHPLERVGLGEWVEDQEIAAFGHLVEHLRERGAWMIEVADSDAFHKHGIDASRVDRAIGGQDVHFFKKDEDHV